MSKMLVATDILAVSERRSTAQVEGCAQRHLTLWLEKKVRVDSFWASGGWRSMPELDLTDPLLARASQLLRQPSSTRAA